MSTTSARMEAEHAAQSVADSPWVERLARFGLIARGVVWILVGALAVKVATGDRSEQADKDGALQTVAQQPFGKVLLVALDIGFAGYALWRLVEAAVVHDGWGKRLERLAKAAVYLALLASTIPYITTDKNQSGNSNQEDSWTAKVLDAPFGRGLVIAAGLAIVAIGLYLAYRGWQRKFEEHLKTGEMSPTVRTWTVGMGVVGHLARGVVFLLIGWFLIQAAIQYDPDETKGLDGALRTVADATYGPWLLAVLALGLVAFGLYSLVESRYRRVLGS